MILAQNKNKNQIKHETHGSFKEMSPNLLFVQNEGWGLSSESLANALIPADLHKGRALLKIKLWINGSAECP